MRNYLASLLMGPYQDRGSFYDDAELYNLEEDLDMVAEDILKEYQPKEYSSENKFTTANAREIINILVSQMEQKYKDELMARYIMETWDDKEDVIYPYLEKEWEKLKGVSVAQ